jgi:hypothetical protein
LCIFIYLLIFTGDWKSLKRAFVVGHLPNVAYDGKSRAKDRQLLSDPEAKIFAQSDEFPRLTNDDGITRLLNELDLLNPNVTVNPKKLSINDIVLVSAWSMNHHMEAQ